MTTGRGRSSRTRPKDVVPARVAIEFNHIFRLYAASGELQAQHSGRLLHHAAGRDQLAAVGDWVVALTGQGEGTATIETILPRRTKFSRKVAGELTEEQVVAANIDTVFLVMGLDGDFNPRRVERYLLMAYESGASPVIVLTKADLAEDVAGAVAEIEACRHRHARPRAQCARRVRTRGPRRLSTARQDGNAAGFLGGGEVHADQHTAR